MLNVDELVSLRMSRSLWLAGGGGGGGAVLVRVPVVRGGEAGERGVVDAVSLGQAGVVVPAVSQAICDWNWMLAAVRSVR